MGQSAKRLSFRELTFHGLFLLALLVLVFPNTFLRGEVPLPTDLLFRVSPWLHYAPEHFDSVLNDTTIEAMSQTASWASAMRYALDHDEWPLWNPFQFGGVPLLANFQSAVFYPPHITRAFLDLLTATTLYTLLKVWLCGLTAFICGRGIGLSRIGAQFLSVAWMLSGYTILWSYWQLTDVAVWGPIIFLGADWLATGRYRGGFAFLCTGAILGLLAGHPETMLSLSLGSGIYYILRLVSARPRGRDLILSLGVAGLAWAVALLACSINLIPFFEYLGNSYTLGARAEGDAPRHFIMAKSLVAFWIPRFFGATSEGNFWGGENSNFVSTLYPGMVVWLGIFSLPVMLRKPSLLRRRVLCLVPPTLFSVALALNLPFVAPLNELPLIGSMWGMHHIAFAMFAVPLLGAMGVDGWFRERRKTKNLVTLALPLAAIVFAAAFMFSQFREEVASQSMTQHLLFQFGAATFFAMAGLVVFALACGRRAPVALGTLIALVLAGDLLFSNRGHLPTAPRETALVDTKLTKYLQALPKPVRVSCQSALLPAGIMPLYGVEQFWGYDGLYPDRMMTFIQRDATCPWDRVEPLVAMEYYLFAAGAMSKTEQTAYEYVETLDGLDVFRNRRAFPYAFLAGQAKAARSSHEAFILMGDPTLDLRRVVVTEQLSDEELPNAMEDDLGIVTTLERTSTRVALDVTAHHESILVIADSYYPGWKAFIDKEEVKLFPVYHAFRGVIIPKGTHRVELSYRPWTFRLGLLLSSITLAIMSLVGLKIIFGAKKEAHK